MRRRSAAGLAKSCKKRKLFYDLISVYAISGLTILIEEPEGGIIPLSGFFRYLVIRPVQLSMLRMAAADDHIVFGSDFPYSPAKVIITKKKHFDENREYGGIREKIYAETAVRLLKGEKA